MLNVIHISVVAVTVLVLWTVLLGWIHWSSQKDVSRSLPNSCLVLTKLSVVYAMCYILLCFGLGLPVWWLAGIVILFVLLFPLATMRWSRQISFLEVMAADPICGGIVFTFLSPVYVVKQFILGFPERDQIVLSPPKWDGPPAKPSIKPAIDNVKFATVTATLRPLGRIECNGVRYDATSFDGTIVDVGQNVEVCAFQNRLFVVRPFIPRMRQTIWRIQAGKPPRCCDLTEQNKATVRGHRRRKRDFLFVGDGFFAMTTSATIEVGTGTVAGGAIASAGNCSVVNVAP